MKLNVVEDITVPGINRLLRAGCIVLMLWGLVHAAEGSDQAQAESRPVEADKLAAFRSEVDKVRGTPDNSHQMMRLADQAETQWATSEPEVFCLAIRELIKAVTGEGSEIKESLAKKALNQNNTPAGEFLYFLGFVYPKPVSDPADEWAQKLRRENLQILVQAYLKTLSPEKPETQASSFDWEFANEWRAGRTPLADTIADPAQRAVVETKIEQSKRYFDGERQARVSKYQQERIGLLIQSYFKQSYRMEEKPGDKFRTDLTDIGLDPERLKAVFKLAENNKQNHLK